MKSTTKANPEEVFDARLRDGDLASRLKLLLITETPDRGRFSQLETQTGIAAATWRTWWTRGAVPSGALVEAVAKCWPHYAYWLITGRTDIRCGHEMPSTEGTAAQGYISNWPEGGIYKEHRIQTGYSRKYLKLTLELDESSDPLSADFRVQKAPLDLIVKQRQEEIDQNFNVPLRLESEKQKSNGTEED